MSKNKIVLPNGEEAVISVPKAKSLIPYGSKILVEILSDKEILGTKLEIGEGSSMEGAPQAYILAVGSSFPKETGLNVGQRIYWTGKGTMINNPASTNGRVNALLEISNVLAIIEEN